ncbi:hypothetical protein C8263_08530 [Deinococcus arcticus]|uniref:Uncharacterized protein n=2 Tax=Deinococcus arcticus TaxID=2136176 RepID=A0A2T3W8C7_9DEIO|nr:hypothetical protein C8263_08530 [Deinococcus arcticus]
MQVFKVVSRVKVQGERRFPFRVVGLAPGADLYALARAIVAAFDFDFDHAFGFFDGKNPYRAQVAYELFKDMEMAQGPQRAAPPHVPAPPAPPAEAQLALMLLLETVDRHALMRETAAFLARRLEEELLPHAPERLRAALAGQLRTFADGLLLDEEQDEGSSLPPQIRERLAQPGGLDAVLGQLQVVGPVLSGPGLLGPGLPTGREEHGVKGVPATVPFGRQATWTFLFDYGDDWTFDVTYQGLQDAPPRVRLPRVLDALGTAPQQYPDWDA